MNNDELKKKIVDIALHAEWTDMFGDHNSIGKYAANAIADAIIAAGIGDVKEAEHRAEKYERALKLMARGECTFASPEYYIKQAEKELAEEMELWDYH